MAILSVRNLSKFFIYDPVFKGVNFHIEEGEKIGLIGNNGSGKTTLLNVLYGEMQPDDGEIYFQKDVNPNYLKQYTKISSDKSILDECLEIFCHIFDMENEMRNLEMEISKITKESPDANKLLESYGRLSEKYIQLEGPSVNSRVKGVLKGLGFNEDDFDKIVNNLSGGQKSRVNLAKLLLSNPNFMFLDEPTNHLDIKSITWLERYLRDYKGTFMVVSHDRFFLDNVVNRIFLMEHHEIFPYDGNYTKFSRLREKDLEIRKKQYENQQREIEREKKIIERFLSVGREKAIRQGQSRLKQLEKIETIDPVKVNKTAKIRFKTSIKPGNEIFIAENLSKSFGDNLVFKNINFSSFRGDRIGIVGENGVGKSTLFKIIGGKISDYSGDLRIGTNVRIGYFDQEMSHLNPDNSIIEEIWDAYPKLTHFEIRSYLAKMMFIGDDILKEIKLLSGGEKARVSLLKLMLSDSNVLLMDEPTNHLDIDSKEILEKALKDYDGTVISISHDRYFLNNFANKIWEMERDSMNEFLGNYSYYVQKKEELESPPEEEREMTLTERRAIQKEEREKIRAQRKIRQQLEKLEEMISELEEEIESIDQTMANPQVAKDYEKILELSTYRDEISNRLEELYDDWMELN